VHPPVISLREVEGKRRRSLPCCDGRGMKAGKAPKIETFTEKPYPERIFYWTLSPFVIILYTSLSEIKLVLKKGE
jgi:hypothetical protein